MSDITVSRKAYDKDLPEIKRLWKEAFGDTDSFIEWNFKYNYNKENTFLQECDGEIASVVQIIPHTLIVNGKKLPAAYIWGMLTAKAHRGKGLARKSFEYILPEMYSQGFDISVLTSAVKGMYEKFGYTTVCDAEFYEEPIEYDEVFLDDKDAVIKSLDRKYSEYVSHKKIYMERPYEYWERILGDICQGSYGKVALRDKGYALLYPEGKNYDAGELIDIEGKIKSSMPVMVRVVNAEAFAKKLAPYQDDKIVTICDDFIKENNINIAFDGGKATVCDRTGVRMNIDEFGKMMINSCGRTDEIYIKFPL